VFPLNLYARVRFFAHPAHETAGAARTRHSLLPLFRGDRPFQQSSGKPCREKADAYLLLKFELRSHHVIASDAKQSIYPLAEAWIASLRSQ
jgi:hypothetical protein